MPMDLPMTYEQAQEIMDRMRRLETRITRFLISQGFDTQTREPYFRDGAVHIPSRACALGDILTVIPPNWSRECELPIVHKGEEVLSICLPEKRS